MSQKITYDRYSFQVNGQRLFIRSGAMHYFRLPSQALWWDRLCKLKAAGYNTVDLYFCWAYHSPAPGEYDFGGIRDVARLLEMTQELGLSVIARPGPYINAEYTGGGLPGWLLADKTIVPRHRLPNGDFQWCERYHQAVEAWWQQIIPFIRGAQNVLMLQVENEYSTTEMEPEPIASLMTLSRELGVTVPLMHNDMFVMGLYADLIEVYSFDHYPTFAFDEDWRRVPNMLDTADCVEARLRPLCPNRPLMVTELQAGWFAPWQGLPYERIQQMLGRQHIGLLTRTMIAQGLTAFSHYKAVGGTNWEHIGSTETYTSYDFAAPIAESGLNTERLYEAKRLNFLLSSFDLTTTEPTDTPPAGLVLSHPEWLYRCRKVMDSPDPATSAHWLFFRNLGAQSATTQLNGQPLTLLPYEARMIPWQVPLACGYHLLSCTAEPLYQTDRWLVLCADRPFSLTIGTQETVQTTATAKGVAELTLVPIEPTIEATLKPNSTEPMPHAPFQYQLRAPKLAESESAVVTLGQLNILLLGSALSDTLWLETAFKNPLPNDSLSPHPEPAQRIVCGPAMQTLDPKGTFQYAWELQATPFVCLDLETNRMETDLMTAGTALAPVAPIVLSPWTVTDAAPEMVWDGVPFQPVGQKQKPPQHPNDPAAVDFDALGQYEGVGWYRLRFDCEHPCPQHLTVDARHLWSVYLNGQCLASGTHWQNQPDMPGPPPVTVPVPSSAWQTDSVNDLCILVDGLGHPKGFHDDMQKSPGLLVCQVDGRDVRAELLFSGGFHALRLTDGDRADYHPLEHSPVVRCQSTFSYPDLGSLVMPLGIQLKPSTHELAQPLNVHRMNLYLNGVLVGRYWADCQAQTCFYLPEGILDTRPGALNQLDLILINPNNYLPVGAETAKRLQAISIQPYGVFTKQRVPAKLNV
ncbi:MAG: beta-galactosidase [Candidatus Melainabacteria bacterium]|nr:beta-galactosidase [Candidatus Melainabacteria bacterium]